MNFTVTKRKINNLYYWLLEQHGSPAQSGQWALWCKRPKTKEEKERIIIESILTQRANWKNVELSVSKMQQSGLMSLQNILYTQNKNIELLIRSSGFYIQKTKRLKNLAKFFIETLGGIEKAENIETSALRSKLLEVHGVGNETADDILLYAFERPVFVIDEYTRRFAVKHNITDKLTYQHLQRLFESTIEKDYKIYQDYHALIVIEMKGQND